MFIGEMVERFNPRVVAAFTATMPQEVENDVRRVLRMPDAVKIFHFPKRTNLKLSSSNINDHNDLFERVRDIEGSALVYCGSQELTVETAKSLGRYLHQEVGFYHSKIQESVKKMYQDQFMSGKIRVMCATNAFGMGIDKALPLDAQVLTPTGWVRNGDLAVGSRVIGRDGKPTKVTHIHERGVVDAYDVTFDDGSTVRCSGDHVWAVRTDTEKHENKGFTDRRTSFIKEQLQESAKGPEKWHVPLVAPVEFEQDLPLPLDPYLLGVLLGGGGTGANRRSLEDLRGYVCSGCTEFPQFVPDNFLWASVENRISLLQGLMDTAGDDSVGAVAGPAFITASSRLREGVVFLARSLGGVPTCRLSDSGTTWQVCLGLPDTITPFRSKELFERLNPQAQSEPTRCIVAIEESLPTEMRCITVEADDGLYVTDEFLVTHNSDIRAVFHLRHPGDPEALSQELGRGGRDGQDAVCHTYESREALRMHERFIDLGYPPKDYYERVYRLLSNRADKSGVFHMSYKEIEEGSKVGSYYLTAIFEAFAGNRVLEGVENEPKVHRLKFERRSDLGRFIQLEHELEKLAARDGDWYLFDLDRVASGMSVQAPTARKYINTWQAEGLLKYEEPPRGQAKRIVGALSLVDFDRLRLKRNKAFSKLEYVKGYFRIPDRDKHDYMQNYFLHL
jgi:hypothetical protein